MTSVISSKQLFDKVIEAIGEDRRFIRRVVIDLQLDSPVFIYIEKYGTDEFLDIDWTKNGIEIKKVK